MPTAFMDVARRIIITSTANDASVVFTIIGTNRDGNPQQENITGVTTTPVQSVLDYLTVTNVLASAATTGSITVGTNGVGSSPWIVDDFLKRRWGLAGGITGAAGTTYTLEFTYNDPNEQGPPTVPAQWSMTPGGASPPHVWTYATINGASGDNQFSFKTNPVFAHRFTITSGLGAVTMDSIQQGIR